MLLEKHLSGGLPFKFTISCFLWNHLLLEEAIEVAKVHCLASRGHGSISVSLFELGTEVFPSHGK